MWFTIVCWHEPKQHISFCYRRLDYFKGSNIVCCPFRSCKLYNYMCQSLRFWVEMGLYKWRQNDSSKFMVLTRSFHRPTKLLKTFQWLYSLIKKMLGLYLYTLIIGHKSCNMLRILNKYHCKRNCKLLWQIMCFWQKK